MKRSKLSGRKILEFQVSLMAVAYHFADNLVGITKRKAKPRKLIGQLGS